jgi:hypothetical protein
VDVSDALLKKQVFRLKAFLRHVSGKAMRKVRPGAPGRSQANQR